MKPAVSRAAWLAAAVLAGWYLTRQSPQPEAAAGPVPVVVSEAREAGDAVEAAFRRQARDLQLRVEGRVERILADDRDGSPHQRFIIRTSSGITLLIAHNLDLAPRLDGLAVGDRISAYGEYEWNDRGGVLHWTHDDPAGRHVAGWIEWRGRRYQ